MIELLSFYSFSNYKIGSVLVTEDNGHLAFLVHFLLFLNTFFIKLNIIKYIIT